MIVYLVLAGWDYEGQASEAMFRTMSQAAAFVKQQRKARIAVDSYCVEKWSMRSNGVGVRLSIEREKDFLK